MKRLLAYFILVCLTITAAAVFSYAQSDSSQSWQHSYGGRQNFPERSASVLIGVHIQVQTPDSGEAYYRRYLELGLHRTWIWDAGVITHGPSVEISPERRATVGFKYSGWINVFFASLGCSAVYYTDFSYGGVVIRLEFGFGIRRFRLGIGFNLAVSPIEAYNEFRGGRAQAMLNVLLQRKLIKRYLPNGH